MKKETIVILLVAAAAAYFILNRPTDTPRNATPKGYRTTPPVIYTPPVIKAKPGVNMGEVFGSLQGLFRKKAKVTTKPISVITKHYE